MKTYLRLITFAKPFGRFAAPYFIYSVLSTLFSLINLALIIPLLDVLFRSQPSQQHLDPLPPFSFSLDYVKDVFYHSFGRVIAEYGSKQALFFLCVVIISSVFLTNLFRYLARRVMEYLRAHSIKNIRKRLFVRISSLHIGYFSDKRKGDVLSRLTTDAYEVEVSLTNSLSAFFHDPFNIIAYFIILFSLSFELTLFTIIVLPVSGVLISFIAKRLKRDAFNLQESLANLISILDETLGGMRVIKAFNALTYIQQKFDTENKNYADTARKMANKREMASPLSEVMGVMVVAGILFYGGNLVLQQQSTLTASEFVGYIIIFSQVLAPVKAISGSISNIQRGIVAAERIFRTIDALPQIKNKPNAEKPTAFRKAIQFKDVSFAYEEKKVLKKINFEIKQGETIALVGPSGGGKSTISDLIPRFYEVNEGEIIFDGKNIKDYEINHLRKLMGIVTQESFLFNDSIFHNIAFGQPNADLDEVIKAAKVANAHDFIMQTQNGYQTHIGDRGLKLSGGQRQRISIARAIFKNPPILILDEATSALDTESEKLVQDALNKLMKNRTSLVIAHRLSTIQNADKIIVIDEGKIVESGTHAALIANREGVYFKLQSMQRLAQT